MTIISYKRKVWLDEYGQSFLRTYHAICCDGCGETIEVETKRELATIWWREVPYLGYPLDIDNPSTAIAFEHFCSAECLDPPEWKWRVIGDD